MQQKADLGADRTALLEGTALRCRQREEQVPVALGKARKTPQKLVLFGGEDLQTITALGEVITVKIIERRVGHATAGSNGNTRSMADIRASMPVATTESAVVCLRRAELSTARTSTNLW